MTDFLLKQICDFLECINAHYNYWFDEAQSRFDKSIAEDIECNVRAKTQSIAEQRFLKIFEFDPNIDFIIQISNFQSDKLKEIQTAIALNWLAFDGIWFQEIESRFGMLDAKICNDNAWKSFSPFEADSIIKRIGLQKNSGIDGLKMALGFRLYSYINKQSIGNELNNSFNFYMNECRVQLARKRKGMQDYPCKSAGIIEYTTFAKTIDDRIITEIIACPPDNHPEEWFCGWKFYIP